MMSRPSPSGYRVAQLPEKIDRRAYVCGKIKTDNHGQLVGCNAQQSFIPNAAGFMVAV
jgi:hypothetical protein